MSSGSDASPLAGLCYKGGCSLDEVLRLNEDELVTLSKEIVGNGVLDHARVIRQWRRCKMEMDLRKEVEQELAHEGEEALVIRQKPLEQRVEECELLQQQREQQLQQSEQEMGEDWQQFLRTQILREMSNLAPPPPMSSVSPTSMASECVSAYNENDDTCFEDEDETTWFTLEEEESSEDHSKENKVDFVGAVANSAMTLFEEGINLFFDGPTAEEELKLKQKAKKKRERNKKERLRKEDTKRQNELRRLEELKREQETPKRRLLRGKFAC